MDNAAVVPGSRAWLFSVMVSRASDVEVLELCEHLEKAWHQINLLEEIIGSETTKRPTIKRRCRNGGGSVYTK